MSTAPWGNPSAWQHKVEWVQVHLGIDKGTPAYKCLILTHHKHLNRGNFLVGDRPHHNGVDKFEGEVIPFGTGGFSTWPAVVDYLAAPERPLARPSTPELSSRADNFAR